MPPYRIAPVTLPTGWDGLPRTVAYRRNDDYGDIISPQHPFFGLDRSRYVEEPMRANDEDAQRIQITPRGYVPPSIFTHIIGPVSPVSTPVVEILPRERDPLFSVFSTILRGARCLPRTGAVYAEYLDQYSEQQLYARLRSEAVIPWEIIQNGGRESALRALAKPRHQVDTDGAG